MKKNVDNSWFDVNKNKSKNIGQFNVIAKPKKEIVKVHEREIVEEIVPDYLDIEYENDYNIDYVDKVIKKKLKKDNKQEKLDKYIKQTKKIIDCFNSNFSSKKVSINEVIDPNKTKLIDMYFKIASRHFQLNIHKLGNTSSIRCDMCSTSLDDMESENGIIICPECSVEKKVTGSKTVTYDKTEKEDTKAPGYDEKGFLLDLERFQGNQNVTFPEKLLERLDNYFQPFGYMTRHNQHEFPLLPNGKKEGTSVKMMKKALSTTGNSSYYKDRNKLCKEYWGWELPNVSDIIDELLDDFKKTQEVFNNLENKGRKYNIGSEFRRYKHLELRGRIYDTDYFNIASTDNIKDSYEILWRKMCEGAGLTYIPTTKIFD